MRKSVREILRGSPINKAAAFFGTAQLRSILLRLLAVFLTAPVCGALAKTGDLNICTNESGDVAIEACTHAILSGSLTPHDLAAAYVSRSVEYIRKGAFDDNYKDASHKKEIYNNAMNDLNNAIQIQSDYYPAFYNRANLYIDQYRYNEALADLTVALRIRPNDVDALNSRCRLFTVLGQYDNAIFDCTKAIGIDKRQGRFFLGLGNAYVNKGVEEDVRQNIPGMINDLEQAFKDYEKARDLDPTDAGPLLGLSRVYLEQGKQPGNEGKYQLAVKALDEAIRLKPNDVTALNNRCWAQAVLGEYDKALSDCNTALALQANSPSSLDSRAFTYLKMCNFDNAIADYDAALLLDGNRTTSLYGRGIAKETKRPGDGLGDLQKAREKDPGIDDDFRVYGLTKAEHAACSAVTKSN